MAEPQESCFHSMEPDQLQIYWPQSTPSLCCLLRSYSVLEMPIRFEFFRRDLVLRRDPHHYGEGTEDDKRE